MLKTSWAIVLALSAPAHPAFAQTPAPVTGDSATVALVNGVVDFERNSGARQYTFGVRLSGSVEGAFTVPYSTADGTAVPGDYGPVSGNLQFTGAADEQRDIEVTVVGDTTVEPDESFTVTIGTPSNGSVALGTASRTGFILNDDSATIRIDDPLAKEEGNAFTTQIGFTLTLSAQVQGGVTVPFSTTNGTATSGEDYAFKSGIVTFSGGPGETQGLAVTVNGDTKVETAENFAVTLGAPSKASVSLADGSGTGVIINDDFAFVAIDNVTLAEGNAGTTAFTFTASLGNTVQDGFTVPFSVVDGTATQPADFQPNSGTLTFTGFSGETRTATVQVVGDGVWEPNETFRWVLGTPSKNTVFVNSNGFGYGTITTDDEPSVSIDDVALPEGNAGTTAFTFTATLAGPVPGGFSVPYATVNGTATQPGDYAGTSGDAIFAGTSGETQMITVQVVGDLVPEFTDTFTGNLGFPDAAGVAVTDAQGLGTILNDELDVDVSVSVGNGADTVVDGTSTSYTAIVTNPSAVVDVVVAIGQGMSAGLGNVTWTCTGSGDATCPANGTGMLAQTRALPRATSLTYVITADIETNSPSPVQTTVTADVQAPNSDPNPGNSSATDSDVVVLPDVVHEDGFEGSAQARAEPTW